MQIRDLRTRLSWSQKDLADYLGCDQGTVSRMENGQEPSGPVARLLAILIDDIEAGRDVRRPSAQNHPLAGQAA